jgi:hypothetical protein
MNKYVKTILIVAIAALAFGATSVAYAQGPSQAAGTGVAAMGGRGNRGGYGVGTTGVDEGILHDYYIAAYSVALDIPEADLEARLDTGETMADIALSTGLTLGEFQTLMVDIRDEAVDQAFADGVISEAQADWLKSHGTGQVAGGLMAGSQMAGSQVGRGSAMRGSGLGLYANTDCPYYTTTNP